MANTRNGNSFYVDSASSAGTSGSFVVQKPTLVTAICFNTQTAGDSITLCDVGTDGVSAGPTKITVSGGVAKDTKILALHLNPILFPNGIWVSAISAGATATIVANTTSG